MQITLFNSATDTRPVNYDQPWSWLCEIARDFMTCEKRRSNKLNHDAMMFGRCEGARSKANVQFLSGLAADFDIGPDDPRYRGFHDLCDQLERDGFAFIAYTTTANDAGHNHFRLLMPYGHDVPFDLCQAAWHACNAKFSGAIDASTKDESRLSFMPAAWTENPYQDRSKGLVTLAAPFNDMRVNITGKPILDEAEITALNGPFTFVSGPVRARSQPRCHSKATTCSTVGLSPAERLELAQGKGPDAPCWQYLKDFRYSPLISDSARQPAPNAQDRVFAFLRGLAWKGVNERKPINVETMTVLAQEFCRRILNREPPTEIARRAEDALAFAFRNFTERSAESRQQS